MKFFLLFISLIFFAECSKYNVKTEINKDSVISGLKSSGIIVRLEKGSIIDRDNYTDSLLKWLEAYNHLNKIKVIPNLSEKTGIFKSTYETFYQKSFNNEFLKYKSLGLIKTYLRNNESELKKIITENNLDSIIFYEINSAFSQEMYIFDLQSVIVIADANLNIIYLDHQDNIYPEKKGISWDTIAYGDVEGDFDNLNNDMLKKVLFDNINARFLEIFLDLDFIEEPN